MKKFTFILTLLLGLLATIFAQHVSAASSDPALAAYHQLEGEWAWNSMNFFDDVPESYNMKITTLPIDDVYYGRKLYISGFGGYDSMRAMMDFIYDANSGTYSLSLSYGQIMGQLTFSGLGVCDVCLYGVDGAYIVPDGTAIATVNSDCTEIKFEAGTTLIYGVEQNGEYKGAWDGCYDISMQLTSRTPTSMTYDGLTFTILDNVNKTCVLTDGRSASGDVVIPSKVDINGDLYTVINIDNNAFYYNENLTSVTIPNSVINIGETAFAYCTELTSVTIPESVTAIGNGPFAGCIYLLDINVEGANPAYTSVDGVLFTKDLTTLVQHPAGRDGAYEIPQGVEIIGDYAFDNNLKLESVTISGTVTTIGYRSFFNCPSLTSLTIGESVTTIGYAAFYQARSLTSVTIPNSVITIGERAFYYCDKLSSVTIGESVTSIGAVAFSSCFNLTSVTIPASVTTIGNDPFIACTSLTSIHVAEANPAYASVDGVLFSKDKTTLIMFPAGKEGAYEIPQGVTDISQDAFYYCLSLTSVTIPASVTKIDDYAFGYCSSLTLVNSYSEVPPTATAYTFEGIPSECTLHVPVGKKNDYANATGWDVFSNIVDDLNSNGVDDVVVDGMNGSDQVTVYTLQGVRVNVTTVDELSTLPKGIYIVNGKKMYVK